MKKNFKIYLWYALALSVCITSCNTVDDDLEPNQSSGLALGLPLEDRQGNSREETEPNEPNKFTGLFLRTFSDTITLRDFSTITNGRTWKFPEGVVNVVGSDNNLTSNDKDVKIYFTKPSPIFTTMGPNILHRIELIPDFKNPTSGRDRDTLYFNVLNEAKLLTINNSTNTPTTTENGITINGIVTAGEEIAYLTTTQGFPRIGDLKHSASSTTLRTGVRDNTTTIFGDNSQNLKVRYRKPGTYTDSFRYATQGFAKGLVFNVTTKVLEPNSAGNPLKILSAQRFGNVIELRFTRDLNFSQTDLDTAINDFLLVDYSDPAMPVTIAIEKISKGFGNDQIFLKIPATAFDFNANVGLSYNPVNNSVVDEFSITQEEIENVAPSVDGVTTGTAFKVNLNITDFLENTALDFDNLSIYQVNNLPFFNIFNNSLPESSELKIVAENDIPEFGDPRSLELIQAVGNANTLTFSNTSNSDNENLSPIEGFVASTTAEPKTYKFSFYAKSTSSNARLRFSGNNGVGAFFNNVDIESTDTDINVAEWKLYEVDFQPTNTMTTVSITFFSSNNDDSAPHTLRINAPRLVEIE